MVEYPSSDGVKANDSICSASRVTRKGPRSISRSRVENDCFPRTPSGSLPRPPDLNKKASGSVSEWPTMYPEHGFCWPMNPHCPLDAGTTCYSSRN